MLKQRTGGETTNESLLLLKQAIKYIYECTTHQPLTPNAHFLSDFTFQSSYQINHFSDVLPTILFKTPQSLQHAGVLSVPHKTLSEKRGEVKKTEQRNARIKRTAYHCIAELRSATISKLGIHFKDYHHLILRLSKQRI